MTTTTDTPRTDAAFGQGRHGAMKSPYETSCQLERELNEARKWLDERYKALSEADERAEKAEANLRRAIEIGEELTCLGLLANFPTELITRK